MNTAASPDRLSSHSRHPSGEMMVLDGRQTLGVRLRDERGEEGRELITLLLPGTEPPTPHPRRLRLALFETRRIRNATLAHSSLALRAMRTRSGL